MRRAMQALVVVAILCVVAGVAVSAIAKSRASAQNLACHNNLKQISLAVHNYRDTCGTFPIATVKGEPRDNNPYDVIPAEKRLSWLYSIIPFVEQCPRFGNPAKPWDDEENLHLEAQSRETNEWFPEGNVRTFECPMSAQPSEPYRANIGHYIGIAGNFPQAIYAPFGTPHIGMFGYDRPIHLEDITDGTGRTLLVVESTLNNGMWTAGGESTVRGFKNPNHMPYGGKTGQFRNEHSQSINVSFVDGSIRSLSADINPKVFEAMATIADGDTVPDF